MALTTYITNLSLTDSWKGTTHQFLSHFKEKHCLLDSLIPLLEVPRELKPLMAMFFNFAFNLVQFICTPFGFQLTMIFSNIPVSSSHNLTFGMLLFWTMVLHLPFSRKFTKQLMIPCSKILCLMNLRI